MAHLVILPARTVQGTLTVPGDKSISHRALLLGALAHGTSRITGCLDSDDVARSRAAVEALGVVVRKEGVELAVEGRGPEGLRAPSGPLDMGNSGTTTRLLLGILAGCPFRSTLIGDESLSKRPMRRVTGPLQEMGAVITGGDGGDHLPLTVEGKRLRGIRHEMTIPSAQVKSALLLAGLSAEGPTTVVESLPTRDHTERMLRALGAKIEIASSAPSGPPRNDVIASALSLSKDAKQSRITIYPGAKLVAREIHVPGDFSSAAFFFVAAAIVPGSRVTVRDVGLNPTRTGLLELLKRMGAKIEIASGPAAPRNDEVLEPVGDVTVSQGTLKAITVEPQLIPNVIDELPAFMVAATQAEGTTRIEGAGELRVKETDRIRSMVKGLSRMGARIRAEKETIVIEGPSRLKGAAVDSCGDHRTAMALAVAGLAASGETVISGSEWINISFPSFARLLKEIRQDF